MNIYELKDKDNVDLGLIKTKLPSETVRELFIKSESDDIEYFIDWLIENDHDNDAERFYVNEVVYVY